MPFGRNHIWVGLTLRQQLTLDKKKRNIIGESTMWQGKPAFICEAAKLGVCKVSHLCGHSKPHEKHWKQCKDCDCNGILDRWYPHIKVEVK